MATLEEIAATDQEPEIDPEIARASTEDIVTRTRLLQNDIKVWRGQSGYVKAANKLTSIIDHAIGASTTDA